MWLTRFAIARPVIVAMFFIGLTVFGLISYKSMGVSLFPNVQFPIVVVSSAYPGASPTEMEKLVVKPIEDEIDGIANLDKLTAVAQEGRMFLLVQFKLDTDLDIAGIDVQHRVDNARVNMPSDINPPFVTSNAGSTAADPIITEAVTSTALSREKLSDLIKDRIVPELKRLPGVDSADMRGEVLREIHVYPDTKRMYSTGTTLADLYQTLASNNSNLPGGRIDQPTQETTVSVHADIVQPQDILAIPIMSGVAARVAQAGGQQTPGGLTIGQVASVEDGHVEQRIVSHYNTNPTIIIDVTRQATADELKTTDAVRKKIAELSGRYARITFKEISANADYTRASVNGVLENLAEGVFLTAIVMLLFLHAWRNALVVMIAIPASLLATFIVMHLMHFTVDLISLMGLGLTIGILVDDSIVVLENITRHRDMGENAIDAAINGRNEIGLAAITITFVDVVVFLPIAFLSGIVGKYMKEFGIVIVVATLFSLFVSFTLTPLLAARWATKDRSKAPPRLLLWFQVGFERLLNWYRHRALPWALAHPKYVVAMCFVLVINSLMFPAGDIKKKIAFLDLGLAALAILALLLGAKLLRGLKPARHRRITSSTKNRFARGLIALLSIPLLVIVGIPKAINNGIVNARLHPRMAAVTALSFVVVAAVSYFIGPIGSEFIPNSETGVIRGTIRYPVGTPLAVTQQGVDRLENALIKIAHVESVTTSAGSMPSGFGSTIAGNVARFTLTMNKNYRKEALKALDVVRKLDWTVPGAEFVAFHEGGGGGGGGPIFYTLSGPDATLNQGAEKLAKFVRAQKGTINVQTGAENEAPRMSIHINPQRAAVLGVAPGDAATAARIAIGGIVATKVRTPTSLVDVRLELPKSDRSSFEQIRQIKVRSATTGAIFNLADVADFDLSRAPTKIERLNRERVVRVTADIDTNDHVSLGDILAPVQKALDTLGFLPPGTRAIAQGDSELFNQTFQSMGLALITSFALVYMLMVILYGSFVEPFVIMFSVPVAMVGAFTGLALRGQTLNLFSMIAVIMLFGLVAKNGILLVDYANTMRKRGQTCFEAMLTAAQTRFRPILMTTCAMVFGMLPLATGLMEGAEERASMGTVLIGGLLSSLVLTLFLVPIMYNAIMGLADRSEQTRAKPAYRAPSTPEIGAALGAPGD